MPSKLFKTISMYIYMLFLCSDILCPVRQDVHSRQFQDRLHHDGRDLRHEYKKHRYGGQRIMSTAKGTGRTRNSKLHPIEKGRGIIPFETLFMIISLTICLLLTWCNTCKDLNINHLFFLFFLSVYSVFGKNWCSMHNLPPSSSHGPCGIDCKRCAHSTRQPKTGQ